RCRSSIRNARPRHRSVDLIFAGFARKEIQRLCPEELRDAYGSALPPDVRRGLCPAVNALIYLGYAPRAGFAPYVWKGRARTRGPPNILRRLIGPPEPAPP